MPDNLPPMVPTGNTMFHQILDTKLKAFEKRIEEIIRRVVAEEIAKTKY